jgi:hypothetical protein
LVEALIISGFLDRDGDRITIHDWADYTGKLLSQRERARARAARHYSSERESAPPNPSTRSLRVDNAQSTRSLRVTGQDKTGQDKTRPKAESRVPRMTPPTLEEVKVAAKEVGMSPEKAAIFHDHYQSNGWMVGKAHMKDWEATLRNWQRRDSGNGHKPGQPLERKLCTWKGDKQYRVRERWDAGQGEWQEIEVLEEVGVD